MSTKSIIKDFGIVTCAIQSEDRGVACRITSNHDRGMSNMLEQALCYAVDEMVRNKDWKGLYFFIGDNPYFMIGQAMVDRYGPEYTKGFLVGRMGNFSPQRLADPQPIPRPSGGGSGIMC